MSLRLKIAQFILGRPIILGQKAPLKAYEPWKCVKGERYWYPAELDCNRIRANTGIMSRSDEKFYKIGLMPLMFATEEHSKEAAKRVLKILHDYHEELGY